MKISGRYSPGLYFGVSGFLLLVGINAFTIPDSLNQARERDQLAAQSELEKQKAEAAKKTADAYSQNGVATFDQLIISDYTLNNTPPRFDWTRSVDTRTKIQVFDRNRLCVGYAYQGRFFFTKYYEGVCSNG